MSAPPRVPLWLWLLAAPLVLVGLAWGLLAVLLPPARATQLVRDQLARSLARDVRFEHVGLSLWPPVRLSVRHLELAEPGGFERGSAFSTAALDLDLDVLALLSHRVRVRRCSLEGPALHLLLRPDGTTNFDGLGAAPASPATAAPPLDLDVREFRVRDGHILVDDMHAGRRTTLEVGTRMSLAAERGGTRIATAGETVLSGLAFGPLSAARAEDLDQGLARLEWHVRHRGKYDATTHRLALETLALELGRTELAFSGLVDSVGPRARFALRARGANLDLEQVLGWISAADARVVKGLSGHGQVAFDLTLLGSAAPGTLPAVTGVLTVKDAAFRYAGAPAEVGGLSLTANFRPDSLVVPDLRASVAGQPIAGRLLVVNLADPMLEFAVRGNLDLAAVAPMLAPADTRLGGHAVVDVSGRGRARDPAALVLGGNAQLRNVSVEGAGLPEKVDNVNGRIDFLPESAAIQRLTARAGQSSYSIDASVQHPFALLSKPGAVPPAEVEFAFRSKYLDLAEILPTTPGAPFLPNATGGGHVSIDRLKHGKLDVSAVQAEVKLAPAELQSPHFALQGYGGTVTGDARFDLRDTRRPVYAVHTTIDKVKADAILGAWTPVKNLLAGTLSSKLEFSGAGQTPDDIKHSLTLVGLAALTDGHLGPGPALDALAQFVKVPKLRQLDFSRLELPMRIQQGRLVTDPVVLTGASGEWRLSGAIGFDGALDYAVSVTLPPAAVEALGARSALAAGALADPQGRMLLDLHVTGSAGSPRVTWDTSAMRSRLAGRASEALAEQRAKLEADAREAARQALLNRFGVAGDTTAEKLPLTGTAARDSVRAAAKSLLKNFFGNRKAPTKTPAPPAPTPPAAAPPTPPPAPPDTSHH
ncbi:MAG TPA: AsmA-like C-terminal region-containing protein [Candidatus Eisenbacteria bacterium]|jgi:hypothetical protein